MDKYKINYYLNQLDRGRYRSAVRLIPKILEVSSYTFHKYRALKIGDSTDIPYSKVKKLELLFRAEGGMENYIHVINGFPEILKIFRRA